MKLIIINIFSFCIMPNYMSPESERNHVKCAPKRSYLKQSYPKAHLSTGTSIEKSKNYTPAKDSVKYHKFKTELLFQ